MNTPLPPLHPGRALAAATAAAVVLGIPLTVLPILDGLVFLAPAGLVARDVGLLAWLTVLPCALLALVAWLASLALRPWLGERARLVAWTLLLLPPALLLLRQTGRVLLQWLLAVVPAAWAPSAHGKLLMLGVCSLALLALMRRWGWEPALARWLRFFEALRGPAWLLLAMAAGLLAWQPPAWMPMASAPVAASASPTAVQGPNVLVIAIDTVAMADADACNPASATMPHLARFAAQATCFRRYQTAGNFTTASTSTIESGLLPWTHHANQPDATVRPDLRAHTVAHALHGRGWRTHSVTDNLLASPRQHGTFRGYDTAWLSSTSLWVNVARYAATRFPDTTLPRLVAASLAFLAPLDTWRHQTQSPYRSEAVYDDLLRLLAQERGNGRPQYVFALTLPPHAPYLAPLSTRYQLLPAGQLDRLDQLMPDNLAYSAGEQARVDQHRLRYRESLMAADAALGDALQRLEREGWLANTVVVITTDHGESFEKGYLGHAGAHLHQPLVHGPLVIRLPGQTAGRVVDQPVSQADLAPTLLDVAGAPPLPHAEGRSLRPLLEGGTVAPTPVFSMALEHQHRDAPLRHGEVAVIEGDWKLLLRLDDGRVRLFHLGRDPGEFQDLAAQEPGVAARLRQFVAQGLARAERVRAAAP